MTPKELPIAVTYSVLRRNLDTGELMTIGTWVSRATAKSDPTSKLAFICTEIYDEITPLLDTKVGE